MFFIKSMCLPFPCPSSRVLRDSTQAVWSTAFPRVDDGIMPPDIDDDFKPSAILYAVLMEVSSDVIPTAGPELCF
jgi:hypothetical protein